MPAPVSTLFPPFTTIHLAYTKMFDAYLNIAVGKIEAVLAPPLMVCVTLWIIVQGILVMRGDLDARKGLTKLITISLIVGLVTSSSLYQGYVQDLFEVTIPNFVQTLGGNMGIPVKDIPLELDVIFRLGESGFMKVGAEIPPMDMVDAMAFEGAQYFFYFALWGIFLIHDLIHIMTTVLVDLGPLFLIGYLFEATKNIANQWLMQLINFGILLLLTSIVATVVVMVIGGSMATAFLATLLGGSLAGQEMGLYELDLFIMTGNALVVALPGIASTLTNSFAAQGSQLGQGVYRHFADHFNQKAPAEGAPSKVSQSTTGTMGMLS